MSLLRFFGGFFGMGPRVLKKGPAARVVFFYQGEEGTYVDEVFVTIFENGIVHIESSFEETTTHLQNCEVLWNYATQNEDRVSKLRLVKKGQAAEKAPNREPELPELPEPPQPEH